MTRSELQAIAATLARMNAALDRCLLLIHRHPPPEAGLIRRTDLNHPDQNHG